MEKLVRDKIIDIMRRSGIKPEYRIAEKSERLNLLVNKLKEEITEFEINPCIEEYIDLLEVLQALQSEIGAQNQDIEQEKTKKFADRGGFADYIVLKL